MFGGGLDIELLMWINAKRPHGRALSLGRVHPVQGRFDMSAITKSEMVSRRKVVSLVGLAAAFGFAAVPTVLAVSDAEAQTLGMERRQERREGRHQRREDRRTGAPNDVRSGARVRLPARLPRLQRVQLPAQPSNSIGPAASLTERIAQSPCELKR
jgi:hypothetical protein